VNELGTSLETSALSQVIKDATWVIPLLQSIHIVTIGVVFVSSLMIALRVMGRMRADEPFAVVWARFAPWMWYGLVVMVVTGVFLVIGEPVREFTAFSFWLKMTLLAIAVIATFVFGRTFAPGSAAAGAAAAANAAAGAGATAAYAGAAGAFGVAGRSDASASGLAAPSGGVGVSVADATGVAAAEFSPGAKAVAAGLMVVWLAIIFLGRAIAYDVEVWGALSLHN
jgi:uncharacterized membrane protein SirB2